MKPSLQLRMSHQLTMTPQLQQAIRLLQMSSLDLHTEIQTAIETNPMLECVDQNLEFQDDKTPPDKAASMWQTLAPRKRGISDNNNEIETLNGTQVTLKSHLTWQCELTPFTDTDRVIAENIIDSINDDGFLDCDFLSLVQNIFRQVDTNVAEIEAVLHRIWQFDPIGVGTRDIKECLLVQLQHLPIETKYRTEAIKCVQDCLQHLGKRELTQIKRKLQIDEPTLNEVIALIQRCNPRPGTSIGTSKAEYIVPDVYTYFHDGHWHVEINPESVPSLKINPTYAAMTRQVTDPRDSQFIKTQLQEAKWFLKSLENRNSTLLKVANAIVQSQRAFLEHGEEFMKPMVLQDIAYEVEMHESTISRVTSTKYIHTPRGTFELKYFFSSHLNTSAGEDCSSVAIRALIKKLISTEEPNKPLSDSKLVDKLAEKGIKVARRTIAKYREGLHIPPSHERKRLK